MPPKPMDSRELGLVLARQLFGLEDLHYGLWEDDLELSLKNASEALQRYNDLLISQLPVTRGSQRVLDVGCGTGHLLRQMLDAGHEVDGVIPAKVLGDAVRERVGDRAGYRPTIYECRFEDFPVDDARDTYDVVLFSESFQYIPVETALNQAGDLLKPGGLLVVCDFFKTDAEGDGGPGDRSLGGGHRLCEFYDLVGRSAFEPVLDRDITEETSRNLELLNDYLMNSAQPAASAVHRYLTSNYPMTTRIGTWLFRKRIAKIRYKYFSGHRSKEVFQRYKTYRLLTYRWSAEVQSELH